MTLAEVAELLTLAAGFDRRTIGKSDVRAWHLVIGEYQYADAEKAVVDHFASSHDYLMPVDVVERVRDIRRARLDAYGTYVPPSRFAGDPTGELEAVREAHKLIADGKPLPPELEGPLRPARGVLPQ